MLKVTIINEIEDRVNKSKVPNYSNWYCGVTEDPDTRKKEHEGEGESVTYWLQWKADSEKDAREIEDYFHEKKMKGAGGGGKHPTWVYIF